MAKRIDLPRINSHEIRSVVVGFLTPAYVQHDVHGRMLNAFSSLEDIKKIKEGYACGNCCSVFNSFQLTCPVCHLAMNVSGQMQDTPADWQQFYDGHVNGGLEHGSDQIRTPEEFLGAVARDSDIDQIPLKKLKPSRHGLGAPKDAA